MKTSLYFFVFLSLLTGSCGGSKKSLKSSAQQQDAAETTRTVQKIEEVVEAPIIEIEEKLVPINEMPPDPHRYFVIIGSFRVPENAAKHQSEIRKDGFTSTLLKNEEGLIRVSVLATDNIMEARSEIRRIREKFPKYFDTWLLIQKSE